MVFQVKRLNSNHRRSLYREWMMPEFRRRGKEMIDYIADYLSNIK